MTPHPLPLVSSSLLITLHLLHYNYNIMTYKHFTTTQWSMVDGRRIKLTDNTKNFILSLYSSMHRKPYCLPLSFTQKSVESRNKRILIYFLNFTLNPLHMSQYLLEYLYNFLNDLNTLYIF